MGARPGSWGARSPSRGLRSILSAGDREKGENGLGAVPGKQAAFREGLEQAVLYAKALDCPRYLILPSSPSMTQDPAARGLGSGRRRHQVLRGSVSERIGPSSPLQSLSWCILCYMLLSVGNSFMLLSCWELSLTREITK